MSRRRMAWIAAACAVGALAALLLAGFLVVQSQWFFEKIRESIVTQVETATGGRVEAKSFSFDWRRLRARIDGFVIHGAEPADKPPLFRAASAAVGFKIVSLLKRQAHVEYLDIVEPRVYLIVYPDGRTNIPEPKVKPRNARPLTETILDLAVGRFSLQNGEIEVESGAGSRPAGPTGQVGARPHTIPFDARGRNLAAKFAYEMTGPRYRGEIAIQPLDLRLSDYTPTAVDLSASLVIEKNRIGIAAAKLATGNSQVSFSGAVEDLASPHGSFQYEARASQADVARFLHTRLLESGEAQVTGSATWTGGTGFSADGKLHAFNLAYRDAHVLLRDFRADGALSAGPKGIDVTGLRLSGFYVPAPANRIPVDGRIALSKIHGVDIDFSGIDVATLGGSFHGDGRLHDLDQFRFNGDIAGFQARRVVAVYSAEPLPWDGRASGPIQMEGALKRTPELRIAATLAITPEAGSAPVHGQITANFDARSGTLDLGRSTVTLPSSRADFSGAIGHELRVHLETRDLNDLLPAVGQNAADFPVRLESGAAIFDGTVTGSLDNPRIAGRLRATGFSFLEKPLDSLTADVAASPANARLDNAILARGSMRAQFDIAVALSNWKAEQDNAVFGNASVHDASVSDLAGLLEWGGPPVSGALNASAQLTGTVYNPILRSDIGVQKGAFDGEPFDRFSARVTYHLQTLDLASGEIVAGGKQVQLAATYDHASNTFDTGRLRFQVATNAMPLDQIATLVKKRPGIQGTVQGTANGILTIQPGGKSGRGFEVADLHADIAARGLQLTGQPLGDARITANSQGRELRAHLESDFANSAIRGDGSWRLEDDYPGSATVTFSKLDFGQLKAWISPSKTTPTLIGSAEGELRIDGPALKPDALKAELRIPKFELAPPPGALPANRGAPLLLHNTGPIVATMANSVVTIESARLAGRATDFTITGRAQLNQKNSLDLRVNGRIDLGILADFNPDITSSGTVVANATIRGALDAPQAGGRMELQNAAVSIADFPNGLANANGVIVFNGDRATIQNLTGESGGGKVGLSGFAAYGGGQTIFRLHLNAQEIRVRYPEGVSTVANASLNLTGTSERSNLTGTITVLRTGFNPQSDFSSLLARSAEPVRTPSAPTGPLGGLNFDIQIQTAPDIQVQSTLTQDIEVEASLRLRGTVSNPALQGRINITQGQLLFFGTKYNINQGSIAFYNPLKIEPIVNVDLETKARGIDVTLTVSGPLGKLTLTPRSDPPLQLNEIVALLATGQTPTSDPSLLAQQNTAPQSWQQVGASALLGQAVASPVAGRLQRFFGVSRLRIDPTLPGVEYNPQARLTLEQQITPQITLTYITVVNSSNPQVVSMEWDMSKQWSAVLLREENGVFGLDFYFKRQFK